MFVDYCTNNLAVRVVAGRAELDLTRFLLYILL